MIYLLPGTQVTKAHKKIQEVTTFLRTRFPQSAGGLTTYGLTLTSVCATQMNLSGGTSNQLAITTTGAANGFTVISTTQTANELCSITSTTGVTSAALMKNLDMKMTALSASAVNMFEVLKVTLESAVNIGNWGNAICGKIDFKTAGFVTGLAGVICGELDLPSTNPTAGAGTYTVFEGELNVPTGFTSTVPVSFINLNAWGAGVANFDTYGYIMDITGVTKASGKVFQDNTAAAASQALRIRINGTPYYIMLTSTGA